MRRNVPRLLVVCMGLLSIVGCASDPGNLDGEWELVGGNIDGVEIETNVRSNSFVVDESTAWSARSITLRIDKDQASGRALCNHYGGPIAIDQRGWVRSGPFEFRLKWGEVFRELQGCGELEPVEDAYFDALLGTDSGRRNGDLVTLTGEGVQLDFKRTGDVPSS